MNSRLQSWIDLAAGIGMIATAAVVVWARVSGPTVAPPPAPPPPTQSPTAEIIPADPQPLAGAQVKGASDARIGIIEYADLECPACGAFVQRTYAPLIAKYIDTGRVRFFFRHFPLPNHQFARPAAIG